MITLEEKYDLLIYTLNWYLLPKKELGVSYLASIHSQIVELEGDHFTFLYKDNIRDLVDGNHFPTELTDKIEQIRRMTGEVEDSLWNSLDFIDNIKWKEIRELVLEVLTDGRVEKS